MQKTIKDKLLCKLLLFLLKKKELAFIKQLLKYGADMSVKNSKGENVLHTLIKEGNIEFARFLFKELSSEDREKLFNSINNKGQTPMQVAIQNRKKPFIKFFFEYEVSKNSKGENIFHLLFRV